MGKKARVTDSHLPHLMGKEGVTLTAPRAKMADGKKKERVTDSHLRDGLPFMDGVTG
jgi:hypothetical protein